MNQDGPVADFVHGCFELCMMRPSCQFFAFLKDVGCKLYRAPCQQIQVDEPHSLYIRHFVNTVPASHAISKLAEVAGVVGLLPEAAAASLARLTVVSPSQAGGGGGEPEPAEASAPALSVLSPQLTEFEFHFHSKPDGPSSANHIDEPEGSRYGTGELHVNLARRLLFIRSDVHNASSGIPRAHSIVIYNGETGKLHAQTRMEKGLFEECWKLSAAQQPRQFDQIVNPFASARPDAQKKAGWYSFNVPGSNTHRVEFFAGETTGHLKKMSLIDATRGAKTEITITDW